jgi:hypothetical protein
MDSLYLSERILVNNDLNSKLISGGILVNQEEGTIRRILTSQEEINTWLFQDHGVEVKF